MCQTRLQLSTFFRVHSSQRTAATTCRDRQMFKWSIPLNLQIFAWQCKSFFVLLRSCLFVKCNLVPCFSVFQDVGLLEIQTFAASHDNLLYWDHAVLGFPRQPSQVLATTSWFRFNLCVITRFGLFWWQPLDREYLYVITGLGLQTVSWVQATPSHGLLW